MKSFGELLFLLDDLPDSVKPVIGQYLLVVARHYLSHYNGGIAAEEAASSPPSELSSEELLKLTPEYQKTLAALAQANSAAGGRRIDLATSTKMTDDYQRWRVAIEKKEQRMASQASSEGEDEEAEEEEEQTKAVVSDADKIRAFHERIGFHFHVGQPKKPPTSGSPESPPAAVVPEAITKELTASSAIETSNSEKESSPEATFGHLSHVEASPLQPAKPVNEAKAKATTTTSTSLSTIFDSPEFASFFGDWKVKGN